VNVVLLLALLLAAAAGTMVVFTRDTTHQVIVYGLYGVILAVVFLLLQAPDVALAQTVISGLLLPLLVLIALAKLRELDR
jgi:energy-converting hydrogenase B subunit D